MAIRQELASVVAATRIIKGWLRIQKRSAGTGCMYPAVMKPPIPFITNYEKHFEQNLAVRTHVNFDYSSRKAVYRSRIGFEGAGATGRFRNFDKVAADPAAAPPVCD